MNHLGRLKRKFYKKNLNVHEDMVYINMVYEYVGAHANSDHHRPDKPQYLNYDCKIVLSSFSAYLRHSPGIYYSFIPLFY